MDRPRAYEVGESDAAHPSEVLPRRGKTSVPVRNMPRQTLQRYLLFLLALFFIGDDLCGEFRGDLQVFGELHGGVGAAAG